MARIKVNATKAFNVEGVLINGEKMVSIRQFYATKSDPEFKPGKQGVTIPLSVAKKIGILLKKYATEEDAPFKELDLKRKNDG